MLTPADSLSGNLDHNRGRYRTVAQSQSLYLGAAGDRMRDHGELRAYLKLLGWFRR